jgi:hypothetical protein
LELSQRGLISTPRKKMKIIRFGLISTWEYFFGSRYDRDNALLAITLVLMRNLKFSRNRRVSKRHDWRHENCQVCDLFFVSQESSPAPPFLVGDQFREQESFL